MMNHFTPEELAEATEGAWAEQPRRDAVFGNLFSDSRAVEPGGVFVALKGERFDGHRFLAEVAAAGAGAVIAERDALSSLHGINVPILLVQDTLRAFQSVAAFHRRRFPGLKLAAVTGSVGKTSTKEMLRAILQAAFGKDAVLATEGNTNNQIGVPQNLLRLSAVHRAAVIEMGTSAFGEIEPLSRTAAPTAAAVNAVAACHLEKLHDLDGVATEKSQVYAHAAEAAILPFALPQRPILERAAEKRGLKRFFFGDTPEAGIWTHYEGGDLTGSSFTLHCDDGTFLIHWHLGGKHQTLNAACAAATARSLGIPGEVIARGLAETTLPGMRMKILKFGGVTYANDAYNANPESMKACLEQFAEFAEKRGTVLVLGDMLELGAAEESGHCGVLKLADALFAGQSRILAVGPRMTRAAEHLAPELHSQLVTAPDSGAARGILAKLVKEGDLVLLKASRGTRLENALPEGAALL